MEGRCYKLLAASCNEIVSSNIKKCITDMKWDEYSSYFSFVLVTSRKPVSLLKLQVNFIYPIMIPAPLLADGDVNKP